MSWLLRGRPRSQWIADYAQAHQHPVNRWCHTVGIPLVVLSVLGLFASFMVPSLFSWSLALFVAGWIFQFTGHAFEGKPPEFFKDWRFLFVGLSWWLAKVTRKPITTINCTADIDD